MAIKKLTRRYNQDAITLVVNGKPVQGLFEGTSIKVTRKGGEVEITEGTDGPGLNQATDQGGEIEVTLQETSPSNADLQNYRRLQKANSVSDTPTTAILYTGAHVIISLADCLVSVPGELSTGDKKQAGRTYKLIGTTIEENMV